MLDQLFLFVDRTEAGENLAAKLLDEPLIQEAPSEELLVLSIPRGGVVVGAAVAKELGCDHDVIAVKKIGYPGHKEMVIGAMAEDGTMVLNPQVMSQFGDYIEQAIERASTQIESVIQKFRQGRTLDLIDKTVIIIDDGIATGETMKAAVIWLLSRESSQRPRKILIAVPVCSPRVVTVFQKLVNKVVCLAIPKRLWAIGQFYWNFDQISDEEVSKYLLQHSAALLLPLAEL